MTRKHDVERTLAQEWRAVLGLDDHDLLAEDFFSLGGDSLDMMELAARVEERLEIEFPIDSLFENGTLAALVDECLTRVDRHDS